MISKSEDKENGKLDSTIQIIYNYVVNMKYPEDSTKNEKAMMDKYSKQRGVLWNR